MVVVAQLVRASDCGSEGRRFETDLPPQKGSKGFPFLFSNREAFLGDSKKNKPLNVVVRI